MFIARAAIYFLIWMVFAYFLNKWSREEDRMGDQTRRLAALSAPGLDHLRFHHDLRFGGLGGVPGPALVFHHLGVHLRSRARAFRDGLS